MSFNKRYINKKIIDNLKNQSIDYLKNYVNRPDCLIIEDEYSNNICKILRLDNKSEIEKKLNDIGFYESK